MFGQKVGSLGQILEKPFVCSRGQIFSLIIMKLDQPVCLEKNLAEVWKWVMWSKKLGH